MRHDYPVRMLCQCFKVSSSGYYDCVTRQSKDNSHSARLKALVLATHYKNRETYGAVRLHRDMVNDGQSISLWKVKDIRRSLGIVQKTKRRFVRTTDSKHNLPVAKNIVAQNFKSQQPNRVWPSDITYIPTSEGWLYHEDIKDVCTKEIAGFSMSDTMDKTLVIKAIINTLRNHKPPLGIVVYLIGEASIVAMRIRISLNSLEQSVL